MWPHLAGKMNDSRLISCFHLVLNWAKIVWNFSISGLWEHLIWVQLIPLQQVWPLLLEYNVLMAAHSFPQFWHSRETEKSRKRKNDRPVGRKEWNQEDHARNHQTTHRCILMDVSLQFPHLQLLSGMVCKSHLPFIRGQIPCGVITSSHL